MKNKTLLSLIIPTKNRKYTAAIVIKNLVKDFEKYIKNGELEIIIYDTSEENILKNELKEIINHISYRFNAQSLGFCDDFNNAVSDFNGEYACIIGDDDLVLPEIMSFVEWMQLKKIHSVAFKTSALYFWENYSHKIFGKSDSKSLKVYPFDGNMQVFEPQLELEVLLNSGMQNFSTLPKLYYGIVSREKLQELRALLGNLFFGTSPDISIAIGLSTIIATHIVVDYPIFLPGFSAASGSGKSSSGAHFGRLEDHSQTKAFAQNWPTFLPRLYSVQTVWAHSGIETLKKLGMSSEEIRTKLNFSEMYANTLFFNFSKASLIAKEILRLHHMRDYSLFQLFYKIVVKFYRILLIRIYEILLKIGKFGKYKLFLNVNDKEIIEASDCLKKYVIDNKLSIKYDS